MDTIYILAAVLLLAVGFAGCVLPVLPGPVLAYGALLVMLPCVLLLIVRIKNEE